MCCWPSPGFPRSQRGSFTGSRQQVATGTDHTHHARCFILVRAQHLCAPNAQPSDALFSDLRALCDEDALEELVKFPPRKSANFSACSAVDSSSCLDYFNFAYSTFAATNTGTSTYASFHNAKKSS